MTSWMGGAIDRVAPGATAFGHRGARAFTWIIGCSGEEPLGPVADWVRRVRDDTAPFATAARSASRRALPWRGPPAAPPPRAGRCARARLRRRAAAPPRLPRRRARSTQAPRRRAARAARRRRRRARRAPAGRARRDRRRVPRAAARPPHCAPGAGAARRAQRAAARGRRPGGPPPAGAPRRAPPRPRSQSPARTRTAP